MKKLAVRKSDKKIISFGTEDMSRFKADEFDIFETVLDTLPDELRFCKYENSKIVIDQVLKEKILNKDLQIAQKRQLAKEYLKKNNPTDIKTLTGLIERVKKLEALLEIYEWL